MIKNFSVIIVGAGHAGFHLAHTLRQQGFDRSLAIISKEPHLPYRKPPLTKQAIISKTPFNIYFRSEQYYLDNQLDLLLGHRLIAIDAENHCITCQTKQTERVFRYQKLVIACGVRPKLSQAWQTTIVNRDNIHTLNSLSDQQQILAKLSQSKHLVLLGAGFTTLELAASARVRFPNLKISLLYAHQPLDTKLDYRLSSWLVEQLKDQSIECIHYGHSISLCEHRQALQVFTSKSQKQIIDFDLLVLNLGTQTRHDFYPDSLQYNQQGIQVDQYLATNLRDIYAIGDCCQFQDAQQRYQHFQSVQNAMDQARLLAHNLTHPNQRQRYQAIAWSWSDIHPNKLQTLGKFSKAYQSLALQTGSSQCSLHFTGDTLKACQFINHPVAFNQAKRLFSQSKNPSKTDFLNDLRGLKWMPSEAVIDIKRILFDKTD